MFYFYVIEMRRTMLNSYSFYNYLHSNEKFDIKHDVYKTTFFSLAIIKNHNLLSHTLFVISDRPILLIAVQIMLIKV